MSEASFDDLFKTTLHGRSASELWQDWVRIVADFIAYPLGQQDIKRHENALTIQSRYTQDELLNMWLMLDRMVDSLEQNREQDFMGQHYMALGAGSKELGQFFTPYHVAALTAELGIVVHTAEIKERGWTTCNDPACGGGALLIACANVLHRAGYNEQQQLWIVAQDINETTALMCYVQTSLLGLAGKVIIGDTMAGNVLYKLYTPQSFDYGWVYRRLSAGEL